jgi:hypothetical protein
MEGVADDFAKDYEALISEDLPFPAVFIAEVSQKFIGRHSLH